MILWLALVAQQIQLVGKVPLSVRQPTVEMAVVVKFLALALVGLAAQVVDQVIVIHLHHLVLVVLMVAAAAHHMEPPVVQDKEQQPESLENRLVNYTLVAAVDLAAAPVALEWAAMVAVVLLVPLERKILAAVVVLVKPQVLVVAASSLSASTRRQQHEICNR